MERDHVMPLAETDVVLVGVLKSRRDQRLLLKEQWYRIPLAFVPKRPFTHVAFYQPVSFGKHGKRIEYVGRITARSLQTRKQLLPNELNHPRAADSYWKFSFDEIERLARPVKNIIPRRVTFGFTTLSRLMSSANILALYDVPATEQMIANALAERGIATQVEYPVRLGRRRYRIDLVIACATGRIAIECDNHRAHRSHQQKVKDRRKDRILRRHGWLVIRLPEHAILYRLDQCISRIENLVRVSGDSSQAGGYQ